MNLETISHDAENRIILEKTQVFDENNKPVHVESALNKLKKLLKKKSAKMYFDNKNFFMRKRMTKFFVEKDFS